MKNTFFFLVLMFWQIQFAQKTKINFVFHPDVSEFQQIKDFILIQEKDTILKQQFNQLEQLGYFYYKTDSIQKDNYYISPGERIQYVSIGNLPKEIRHVLRTRKNKYTTQTKNTLKLLDKIKNHYEQKGISFAEVRLHQFTLQNDTLNASLQINNTESFRTIDKIVIKGYKRFAKGYQRHFLRLQNRKFNQETLQNTQNKLNYLPFVNSYQDPAVLFTKDSTHVYIYIKRVKNNKLDAILGFNNSETGEFKLNGHIDIHLNNSLHKGESLSFRWENNGNGQQKIKLLAKLPYIFKSPVTPSIQFNSFRQDSTFAQTQLKTQLDYSINEKHQIGAYYTSESSSQIGENLTGINDYSKYFTGLSYQFIQLSNNFKTPLLKASIEGGIGKKTSGPNPDDQQQAFTDILYNWNLDSKNQIHLRNRSGFLLADNLDTNELLRIGGANSARGFLEESIFTNTYNYSNIEYRFYTNPISYLYGFTDIGVFEQNEQNNNLIGVGAGYTFGTKSGLIKLSYAVGKTSDTDFDFGNGIFHINFVTVF